MIHIATVNFEGVSPLTQSKHYEVEKIGRESAGEYEKRTWRERMHADDNGHIVIPPMAFKKSLENAAKFLGKKVPGRGNKTYQPFFKAAVLITEGVVLPVKRDDVPSYDLFVPSDGVSGGGSRVMKTFGRIDKWGGNVVFYVGDETISKTVFLEHIEAAGSFVGIGMFRPERGGYFGRFKVNDLKWEAA